MTDGDQRFVQKFYEAYTASYDDEPSPEKARALTRYGMTLIDTRCDLFFEQIGRGAQTGDFARREFQSITAALIAALGLTAISKDAITGVGIGSALGTQTIDNYSTVYFFSPDVSAVQRLVRRAFTSLRTSLLSSEQSPRDFDAAIGALRTYQTVCTAHEIKRLVTEAIDEGQTITQFGDAEGPRYAAAAASALDEMADAIGVETLSPRDAALLQMLVDSKPRALNTAEADYACSVLSASVRDKTCTGKAVALNGETVPVFAPKALNGPAGDSLRAGWATLRALVGTGFSAEVDRQRAVIETSTDGYRDGKVEKAGLQRQLADTSTKSAAEIKTLRDRLTAAEDKIGKASVTSEIVSEQAAPPAPVTGVGVLSRSPAPPQP